MEDLEDYVLEAFEIVSAWGLPEEELADAVNAQARLMAGITPEGTWEDHADIL